jgi:hypothetical protein
MEFWQRFPGNGGVGKHLSCSSISPAASPDYFRNSFHRKVAFAPSLDPGHPASTNQPSRAARRSSVTEWLNTRQNTWQNSPDTGGYFTLRKTFRSKAVRLFNCLFLHNFNGFYLTMEPLPFDCAIKTALALLPIAKRARQ